MVKGYFPHKFNIPENQSYVGKLPEKEYFAPDAMKPDDHEEFNEWYKSHNDDHFDFLVELKKYCDQDVNILAQGCRKLRKMFLNIENIDPFQYVTIASLCMNLYRSKYMPENTIGVVDTKPKVENHSENSIAWLKFLQHKHNVNIQHALNGGQVSLPDIGKVDGFCEENNTVYEFQGCYWHGCKKHFSGSPRTPREPRTPSTPREPRDPRTPRNPMQ